jgi:hypothetical protein
MNGRGDCPTRSTLGGGASVVASEVCVGSKLTTVPTTMNEFRSRAYLRLVLARVALLHGQHSRSGFSVVPS